MRPDTVGYSVFSPRKSHRMPEAAAQFTAMASLVIPAGERLSSEAGSEKRRTGGSSSSKRQYASNGPIT